MTQFLRRNSVRIVIGAAMATTVYGCLLVWIPYQREQRIAALLDSQGDFGYGFGYRGPKWIPQSLQTELRLFDRITDVSVFEHSMTSHVPQPELIDPTALRDLLSEFGALHNLEDLSLRHTRVTDAELGYLKGLTKLKQLHLDDTQTTSEGRARLRKALPNCKIYPPESAAP